jgi:hypothetical protein
MKIIKNILVIAIITLSPLLLNAQPKPPGTAGHGTGQNQPGQPVGGGAPIDGGLSILLAMGLIYGSKKVYQIKKAN